MSCFTAPRAWRCPSTVEEVLPQLLAELPQGPAWPASQDPGLVARYFAWLAGSPSTTPDPYVQVGFFASLAAMFAFVNKRLCDLREEFWCASHVETHDRWMAEWGLPDGCDPFPDLCVKVAAIGGATCAFYEAIAAEHGWAVRCITDDACSAQADCAQADCARAGAQNGVSQVRIEIDLGASSAFVDRILVQPYADALRADELLACPPDITPLQCLMERIVHAHLTIDYVTLLPS